MRTLADKRRSGAVATLAPAATSVTNWLQATRATRGWLDRDPTLERVLRGVPRAPLSPAAGGASSGLDDLLPPGTCNTPSLLRNGTTSRPNTTSVACTEAAGRVVPPQGADVPPDGQDRRGAPCIAPWATSRSLHYAAGRRRAAASKVTEAGLMRLAVSKILNHVESEVTATYDRHGYEVEKQAALEGWAWLR